MPTEIIPAASLVHAKATAKKINAKKKADQIKTKKSGLPIIKTRYYKVSTGKYLKTSNGTKIYQFETVRKYY